MESNKIKLSELKELIKKGYMEENAQFLNEKKKKDKKEDKEEEEDIEIDVEDIETMDGPDGGGDDESDFNMGGEADEVLTSLIDAKTKAEGLGDAKLMRQIGNTITMLTRKHIAKTEEG